jgi:hypothetical protein
MNRVIQRGLAGWLPARVGSLKSRVYAKLMSGPIWKRYQTFKPCSWTIGADGYNIGSPTIEQAGQYVCRH